MRKLLSLTALGVFAIQTNAQLSYTESSSGLQNLVMESGQCIVRLADLNNDGNLDLVSLGDHGNPQTTSSQENGLLVWKGNGTGNGGWTFTKSNGGYGYGGVTIADANKDGKLDIGIGIHHNGTSGFCSKLIDVGLGSGTSTTSFSQWSTGLATAGETFGMFGVDFGDFNNDGWLDIGSNCIGYMGGVQMYKNNGDGTWTHTDGGTGFNSNYDFFFADFDNDGFLDAATASNAGTTHFGNGTGGFNLKNAGFPTINTQTGAVRAIGIGDVNNDGASDISYTINEVVYVSTWNKVQQKWIQLGSGLPTTANVYGTLLEDMDVDGNVDLVCYTDTTIDVYKGNGGTSWSLASKTPHINPMFNGITAGDVDHDGYPDMVVVARPVGDYLFNYANRNKIRLFKHDNSNVTLSVTPGYPKGNECWKPGSIRFITWNSGVPTGVTSSVKLEYSTNGNSGPWTTITSTAKNVGKYQWEIPTGVNSNNCYIRYTITPSTGSAITATTPYPFNIGTCVDMTTVGERISNSNIELYPNPVKKGDFLNVNLYYSNSKKINYSIVDITGRLIYSEDINVAATTNTLKINTSSLQAGVYIFTLVADGEVNSKRITVVE